MKRYGFFAAFFFLLVLGPTSMGFVLKPHIRPATMIIEKEFLESVQKDGAVKKLVFNNRYKNRYCAKDVILLTAYVERKLGGRTVMEVRDLEEGGRGESYPNELRFSSYTLDSEHLATLLAEKWPPDTEYFLLQPELFKGDRTYLRYRITPAGANKQAIAYSVTTEKQKGASGEELPAARSYYLNPSPPATEPLSVEQ